MLSKIMLLGIGGFIGSNLRYWISLWAMVTFGNYIPYGTLIVNAIGSFILGMLTFYGVESIQIDPRVRLLIGTGMMGALTTFSTFSLETFNYLRDSDYSLALINIGLNVAVSLCAVWLGFMLAKIIV
ncbi:MAG: fluoride efflux transporter CrcB [Clostridiaceae bacterium]|nr:fluoride efflux transporter CrcB [Clostridiaceae bacterium]